MIAGNLKEKIYIYALSKSKNTAGERVRSYTLSFPLRAGIKFASAAEKQIGPDQHAEQIIKFKVRFSLSRYSETQLIKWHDKYYNITGIDPDSDRKFNILTGVYIPTASVNIV